MQVKEAELRTLKLTQEKQLMDIEEERGVLAEQKAVLETQHAELSAKVQELDSEKRKEVSQV